MKKIMILAAFVHTIFCTAQYTAIPDANFENYLEQNGMGDGVPNNGLVLTANIENVTELVVFSKGIQNLAGIEDFAAVELINCANNHLPLLDVSQNINLWGLNCASSNITELILPPTATLEIIYCPENFLTALDISQNPGLAELYCDINSIESLDISNNHAIELLSLNYNNISGFLDTRQNPVLQSIYLSDNNITKVDLSSNTALLTFGASNNPFQELDARNGNNENIQTFVAYGTSGNLDCILVDDANATYLDDWFKDPGTTFVNNQAECDALGVAAATLQDFTMYPNPATSTVAINLPNQGIEELVVTVANNLGQVLQEKEYLENKEVMALDVSGYTAGVYFVTLKTLNETITKKLVVR